MAIEIITTASMYNHHAQSVQERVDHGWEIVSHNVCFDANVHEMIYSTLLRTDDAKSRVNLASMRETIESLQKSVRRLEKRIAVLEENVADSDEYAPANYAFVPVGSIPTLITREEIVEQALQEDQERGL